MSTHSDPYNPTCHVCSRKIGGPRSGGHCMTCHLSFATDKAFDKHRTGAYGVDRRCLTTEEMLALVKPMRLLDNGRWSTGNSSPADLARLAKLKSAG